MLTEPDTPEDPEVAVFKLTDPELLEVPVPDTKEIAPPVS
jgi:hypothetical protein